MANLKDFPCTICHDEGSDECGFPQPNTRRAAPVEGFETVGYVTTSPTGAEVFQRKPLVPGHGQFGYKQDAVVTRSQAEAIIAVKDKRISELEELLRISESCNHFADNLSKEMKTLETDNAALTARVKELEGKVRTFSTLCEEGFGREEALETQLAAAKEREEHLVSLLKAFTSQEDREDPELRAALEAKP